jgi:large subunit ribosomal protein L39e
MGSIKTSRKKVRLAKAARTARPVPIFIRLKTGRRVTTNPKRRHWRTRKLRKREKE